jgi:hypothetical protein
VTTQWKRGSIAVAGGREGVFDGTAPTWAGSRPCVRGERVAPEDEPLELGTENDEWVVRPRRAPSEAVDGEVNGA